MKRPIVIIDGSNVAYRAAFVMKAMSYQGKSVAAQFGFMNIMGFIVRAFKPHKVYVVWDGAKHKVRMETIANYKGHREQDKDKRIDFDKEGFIKAKKQIIKLLDYLGIKQALNPQGEADDLIYQLVKKWEAKSKRKILIVSNDKDFNQLITKQVRVWNDNKKMQLTPLNLKKHYGYTPEQTVDYLTLVGDKTDDIPGYKGVGEVTARKLLEEHGSLFNYVTKCETHNFNGGFKMIKLGDLKVLMGIAKIMIDLKYFHENYSCPLLFINKKPKFRKHEYLQYAAKFGFRQFIQPEFLKLFKS